MPTIQGARRCLTLLPALAAAVGCSHRMGATFDESTGKMTSFYSHTDIGTDAQAVSGGAEAFAVVGQEQSKSFRNAMTAGVAWKMADVQETIATGDQQTDRTAIKEGAQTERTGIIEGAQTERLRETETTKRVLEGVGG